MIQLKASIGEHTKTVECEFDTLEAARKAHNMPIEVAIFGQNLFISLMGTTQDVKLEIFSPTGELLDSDAYQIRF